MIAYFLSDLFIYWFLRILLMIVLAFCGYYISYGKQEDFKIFAFIAIIFYSLIQGLRWDRGQDYMHYYYDLIGNWITQKPEILYKTIVNSIRWLEIPYWGGFVIYSLLLISAVLLIFKVYPKAAFWGLPVFYIITASSSENLIRQYIAISFLIYAYYAYLKNKKILTAIFLCCVPMFHIAGLMPVVVFILLSLFKIPIKKPLILLIIYFAFLIVWDVSYLVGMTDYLSFINLGDDSKMQYYLNNSERWFTNEGSMSYRTTGESYVMSLPKKIVTILSQLVIIYYGFKAQVKDHRLQVAYYFAYIAIIVNIIGEDIEMFSRFYNWLVYLSPLILGVAMYNIPMKKYERYAVLTIFFGYYYFYSMLYQFGNIPYSGYAFIWNK